MIDLSAHTVLTVEEVAQYLHISPSAVYRMVKRGKLPGFKVGSEWRFDIKRIDDWRFAQEQAISRKKTHHHNGRG